MLINCMQPIYHVSTISAYPGHHFQGSYAVESPNIHLVRLRVGYLLEYLYIY